MGGKGFLEESREFRESSSMDGGTGGRPESDSRLPTEVSGYVSLIWRRKWVMIPFLVLMPIVGYLHAASSHATYEASAQVLLNQQSQALSGVDNSLISQPERVIRTQADIARLPEIAQRVVNAAKLDGGVAAFLKRSSVDSNDQIDLLTFRVRDAESGQATRLSDLYAREYVSYRRELDTTTLREASHVVAVQIAKLRKQGLSINSALFASLADRQQQFESAETLQKSNALVVRQATRADQVEPQPRKTAMIALAVGIVLALSLGFLLESLDTRVRDPEELSSGLALQLLGSLPEPRASLRRHKSLVMLEDPNSPEAELYRIIRIGLDVPVAESGAHSVMVTSGLEADGKSTTAANLAVSLARAGKHVILVELDLRRPSLGGFFDLGGRPGITDVVAGRAPLEEAAMRIRFDGAAKLDPVHKLRSPRAGFDRDSRSQTPGILDVIGRGTPPANPGEFIVTSELGTTLKRLQRDADLVIVDSPPLLLAADALVLGSMVDSLILIARVNTLRRGQVREIRRMLKRLPAAKLGLVVSGAVPQRQLTYYGSGAPGDRGRPAALAG